MDFLGKESDFKGEKHVKTIFSHKKVYSEGGLKGGQGAPLSVNGGGGKNSICELTADMLNSFNYYPGHRD